MNGLHEGVLIRPAAVAEGAVVRRPRLGGKGVQLGLVEGDGFEIHVEALGCFLQGAGVGVVRRPANGLCEPCFLPGI